MANPTETPTCELFLELLSEEIPARMQARAAEDLSRLVTEALAPLSPAEPRLFSGPRRIALALEVAGSVAASTTTERGPRESAPAQALDGFLRKHQADRASLTLENGFWVLAKQAPALAAAGLVATALPGLLRRFPWPKSMRWGAGSSFTWVRPLTRIVCLLDGVVVPFDLAEGEDDGHGLASSNLTEGHRFLSPGPVAVEGVADWQGALAARHVVADAQERRRLVESGLAALAAQEGLTVVADAGLLDEVAGLVEWPVPLIGSIGERFMDLPPEVMQVSMRVNQRYFALRTSDGHAAARFGFIANTIPRDGGAIIVAGNERVLAARFADARHFWDLDRATKLADRVAALDGVTFHAKLGTQGARALRLQVLAAHVATAIGADPVAAARAGLLAKADLTTGMVGEFPELQGVMGAYYARHDGEPEAAATAIGTHYQPRGPGDAPPAGPVSVAVALADKIDTLAGFFAIGEKPGGSGDPYALRRAALGVIRIIREHRLRLDLDALFHAAAGLYPQELATSGELALLPGFIAERLRVQLRAEGARHDVLAAVSATGHDPDLTRLLARTDAVTALLDTDDGHNLLAAAKRAANILRIEDRKDGPHGGEPDPGLMTLAEERDLDAALNRALPAIETALAAEDYVDAMTAMASLRVPLDLFFDKVTVNADEPAVRRNRLRLLARTRDTLTRIADFTAL
ncbi:glycine--tRNA ligase subunit beta [Lichenicola sp.]|uniref:glycine--tRNA ligase subunit beta n=1 Tax=Lichenicola sp. TaxID=2804529 RepID=UPI003B0035ED